MQLSQFRKRYFLLDQDLSKRLHCYNEILSKEALSVELRSSHCPAPVQAIEQRFISTLLISYNCLKCRALDESINETFANLNGSIFDLLK
jgi:hypothetical protein